MLELRLQQGRCRHLAGQPRAAESPVERFLIESERRVIVHCQELLRAPDLPIEDRRRVERLVAEAEARLRELASIQN